MNGDSHTQQFLEMLNQFALDKNVDPEAILRNILRDKARLAETKPIPPEKPNEELNAAHNRDSLLFMRTDKGDPPDALVTFKLAARETPASVIRASMRAKEKKPKRPGPQEISPWHRSDPSDYYAAPAAPDPAVAEGAPGLSDPIGPAPGFGDDPPYDASMHSDPNPMPGAVTDNLRFSELSDLAAVRSSSLPRVVETPDAPDNHPGAAYYEEQHCAMQNDTSPEERPLDVVVLCAFTMRDIERAADANMTSCLGYLELSVGDCVRIDYWSDDGWEYGARGEESGWFPAYCTDVCAVRPPELTDVPVALDPPKCPPPPQPVRHPPPPHVQSVNGWSDSSICYGDAAVLDSTSHPSSWVAGEPSSPTSLAGSSGGWVTVGHCPPAVPPPAYPSESPTQKPVLMKAPPRAFHSPPSRIRQPHEAASWQDGWQSPTLYSERTEKEPMVPPLPPPPQGPAPRVAWRAVPEVAPAPNWDSWEPTDSWVIGSQPQTKATASTNTLATRYKAASNPPATSLAEIMEAERRAKEEKEAEAEERRAAAAAVAARAREKNNDAQRHEPARSLREIMEEEEGVKPKPKKAKAPKVPKKNKAAEARRKADAEEEAALKEKQEAEAKAKLLAEARQIAEAEQEAKAAAEERAKAEAEKRAKAEADKRAKTEAEQRAKAEAEQRAKTEAEQRAKTEAEQRAKAEVEKAKAEAGQKARAEAEQKVEAKKKKKAVKAGSKADTDHADGKNEPKSKAKAVKEQAPQSTKAKVKTAPGFAKNKFTLFMSDSDVDSEKNDNDASAKASSSHGVAQNANRARDAKDGGKKKRAKAKEMTALLEMDKLEGSKPASSVEEEPPWEPALPRSKKDQQKPRQDSLPQRNVAPHRPKILLNHGMPTPSSTSGSASAFLHRTMPATTRVINDAEEKLDPESARYMYRRTDAPQEIKSFWGDPRNGLPQQAGRGAPQSTAMARRGAPSAAAPTWPSQFARFNPESISELVSMGFEKEKATHALAHMNGNLSSAVEWLLAEAACK